MTLVTRVWSWEAGADLRRQCVVDGSSSGHSIPPRPRCAGVRWSIPGRRPRPVRAGPVVGAARCVSPPALRPRDRMEPTWVTQVTGSEASLSHGELAGDGRQTRRQGTTMCGQQSFVEAVDLDGLPAPTRLRCPHSPSRTNRTETLCRQCKCVNYLALGLSPVVRTPWRYPGSPPAAEPSPHNATSETCSPSPANYARTTPDHDRVTTPESKRRPHREIRYDHRCRDEVPSPDRGAGMTRIRRRRGCR
jgi:hypothetical protein